MITAVNLGKTFQTNGHQVVALQGLDLNIPTGSIVGILGPNGAGKTTTVRLLSTIYRPTVGGATVDGHDIIAEPLEVRKSIGISTEKPSFYDRLSARRNLEFYSDIYGMPKAVRNERINQLLNEFNLFTAAERPVGSFSKGMRQKLSVIKALLHEPPVLMFDEPWAGLSPTATKELREIIAELAKQESRTIMITTHNLAQAELLVDRLIIISNGKKIADGTPDELRSKHMLRPELLVKVETNGENLKAVEALDHVHAVNKTESYLKIGMDSFEHTPELLSDLIGLGLKIHELKENIPSLEDIYLEMVKE